MTVACLVLPAHRSRAETHPLRGNRASPPTRDGRKDAKATTTTNSRTIDKAKKNCTSASPNKSNAENDTPRLTRMDNTQGPCHFARLPYELRQRIFAYALRQKGTIALQRPVWDVSAPFEQPLFTICRSFRDEALEAFYKTNSFLWQVNRPLGAGGWLDSDPTEYPLTFPAEEHVTPSLPWHYPWLTQDLRCLFINVFLPAATEKTAWPSSLAQQLESVVVALERGCRLRELQVTFITYSPAFGGRLNPARRETLRMLAKMRVPGFVKVRTRPAELWFSREIAAVVTADQMRA